MNGWVSWGLDGRRAVGVNCKQNSEVEDSISLFHIVFAFTFFIRENSRMKKLGCGCVASCILSKRRNNMLASPLEERDRERVSNIH